MISSAINNYILEHYELGPKSNDYPFQGSTAAPGFILVANDMPEILEWDTLIFGTVTFFSALISYLLYKSLKNP